MILKLFFYSLLSFALVSNVSAQRGFIYTREGRPILNKRELVDNCIQSLNRDRKDQTAVSICECQVAKIDRNFSFRQYQKHKRGNIIDLNALFKEDSVIANEIDQCYKSTGKTILLSAEGFSNEFINSCVKNIQNNTERTLDPNKLNNFCSCQLDLIKTKKLTDAEVETLSNPNSLLFYEVMYKCGDPFEDKDKYDNTWTPSSAKDVNGPATDTVNILTLNGMTYVKIKTGSLVQFWLFDTGASDLLINKDMEADLKKEGVITESSYLGVGEYEMANGVVDTCRKYRVNNIRIGQFTVNNVVIAVTDKGKRIIAGKGLLNKFTNYILNNKDNTLVLNK